MDAVSGKTFPVINPATGKKVVDVAEGDKVNGSSVGVHFTQVKIMYMSRYVNMNVVLFGFS